VDIDTDKTLDTDLELSTEDVARSERSSADAYPAGSRYRNLGLSWANHRTFSYLGWLAAVLVTIFVLADPLRVRIRGILDPFSFNGDALQHIAPIWLLHGANGLANDYILNYYREAILPPLFKGIYWVLTLWATPAQASKILTVVLSALFIATSSATSTLLAGRIAGYFTLFLATGGVLKGLYFMGGIQRGFGIWLAALALYLACKGRVIALGVLSVIATTLYPAAAVYILCVTALLILAPERLRDGAAGWSLTRKVCFLGVCGALIGVCALPMLLNGAKYGERLSLSAESEYAEWGERGRYTQGDRGVQVNLFKRSWSTVVNQLSASTIRNNRRAAQVEAARLDSGDNSISANSSATLIFILTSISGIIALWLQRRAALRNVALSRISPTATRCAIFGLAMVVSFLAASVLFPLLYIPSRYVALGLTPLIPVVFPAIWSVACRRLIGAHRPLVAALLTITISVACCVMLGWHKLPTKEIPTASGNRGLFRYLQELPEQSVIAAWPRGLVNMVPLFTKRSVILFEEGHQIFHRDFLEEARLRMRAIQDVYTATDSAPIEALRQKYNVTHLLIDKRHLRGTPTYFDPFHDEIAESRRKVDLDQLYILKLAREKSSFVAGNNIVIDLR
jgi:hypothetical protein